MDVNITFEYRTLNVVPPRCRKPRTVYDTETITVTVPAATSAAAPVAFRVPDRTIGPTEYRWWDDRLWIPYLPWSHQSEPSTPGSGYFPATVKVGGLGDGRDAALQQVRDRYAAYLIIDGVVWKESAGEPIYTVATFGLGNNHGGTALLVDDMINRHGPGNCFRADQFEAARGQALEVAAAREDNESLSGIRDTPPIEVLIPEAIRSDPQRDATIERANEELSVVLPRSAWQQAAAQMAGIPELQVVRASILNSI